MTPVASTGTWHGLGDAGRPEPESMRVRLLGGFQVSVGARTIGEDGWRLRKAASLVKLLALTPGHRLHREVAMDLLWSDLGMRSAANNLRGALHAARRALEPATATPFHYLQLIGEELSLCPDGPLWVDVDAFEEAAATARYSREPAAYRVAIELYAGELLPADRYEEWAQERRENLRGTYLALLSELSVLYREREEYARAIQVLRGLLSEEPAVEEAHAGLMRLYALSGRRGEALRQYELLERVLRRELGAEPGAESRCLREEIFSGRFPSPHQATEDYPPDATQGADQLSLPAMRSTFIGRERDMVEVRRLLAMTGLLTLTGTGGSGKTRLALEVARDLAFAYPDGVRLIELAGLSEGTLVPQTVAMALGIREQPGRTLADALRTKKMLLVLDNCEHLIEHTSRLVDKLLSSCPRLRVLATSREPLGIAGEVSWQVPPLPVPGADSSPATDDLVRYESVRLFLDRARLRLPTFEITNANAGAVAEVCRRLEGIPLAIELATARMTALAIEQVAEKLEDSLKLLTGGARTAAPRQQTMRATLEWSHDLLSEAERKLFGRLSVFAGGWTLEAAEVVGAGDGIGRGEVLDLLSKLVDKSLVVAEARAEGTLRYRMLEPVRQHSLERLERSSESEAARHRHAAFFLALAEMAESELRGTRQGDWLERLDLEHDNLRAALSWSLEAGEAELGLRLAGALGGEFWHMRGHLSEGRRWLEATLASEGGASEAARAKALACAGLLAWEQGDYERSVALGQESLTLSRKLCNRGSTATALYTLAWTAMFTNELKRASTLAEEALALQREINDRGSVARTLLILGLTANARHDYERAMTLHEESLALAREAGDGFAIVLSLAIGAYASLGRGDHRQTRTLYEEGLGLSRQLGMPHLTAAHLHAAACSAGAQNQAVRSARLWGAGESLLEDIGTILSPVERDFYKPYIEAARAELDEAAFEAAWAEGRAITQEEAIEYALGNIEPFPSGAIGPETVSADKLTRREREVAALVGRGITNRLIASELGLSERTVESHVRNILKKLALNSRAQLAALVTRRPMNTDRG